VLRLAVTDPAGFPRAVYDRGVDGDRVSSDDDTVFDRENDAARLRDIEALLAEVEAELSEPDGAPDAPGAGAEG